ncbi:MAG: hypothetical protein QGH06_00560, partial [Lutibacter sp.]|nr:hypothetical protein [Lutibacter sp.]
QLQVATDAAFSQIVQTKDNLSVNSTPVYLDKGVFYYWRVKAFDINGNETAYTAAYQFFTQGDPDINHLPFSPELVSPSLGAIEQNATTTLEWNASDVDGDSLTYDVYVDTVDPPATKVAENQAEKTHTLDLTTTTNYYWRVVVKDGNGGETQGQVWHFVTD